MFADCFTDPVHADYSENGLPAADFVRDDLLAIVRGAVGGYTATQHLSPNHIIEFDDDDPDRAICTSCMYAQHHVEEGARGEFLLLRVVHQPPDPHRRRLAHRTADPTHQLARSPPILSHGSAQWASSVSGQRFGPTLSRCARLMAAGHGGQVLCSAETAALARGESPSSSVSSFSASFD
jgi:hypothetical protein